jgi:glycosyltransferase involved in cell wall biosynthesis
MRILIISNYFPPLEVGGWEQLAADAARSLEARGHEVLVLTSRHRAGEIPAEVGVWRRLFLENDNHEKYSVWSAVAARGRRRADREIVAEAARAFAPEVVFINGMWNLPVDVALAAEGLCAGRVVYYMASHWTSEPDAHAGYWLAQGRRAILGRLKRLAGRAVLRWVGAPPRNSPGFRRVLCVSGFMRQYTHAHAGIPLERMRVVHNGIELADFPYAPRTGDGTLRLLYAGRVDPAKGVHTAVEAMGLVGDLPRPVTLSILGGGAPDYAASLRAQIERAGLGEAVRFLDFVPRARMPALLHQHDALVFPSIWDEPLARMVQEAMACGLAVIGTNTGGTPEILTAESGLVFPPGDAAALAAHIRTLAADPARLARLSRAARQTVEARFSLARMVDELEEEFGRAGGREA